MSTKIEMMDKLYQEREDKVEKLQPNPLSDMTFRVLTELATEKTKSRVAVGALIGMLQELVADIEILQEEVSSLREAHARVTALLLDKEETE